MENQIIRCQWAESGNDLMKKYHDEEWGVPVYDDKKLFEFMVLDAFQAGLSWQTILNKRENFRRAFDEYDVEKIAAYKEDKINALLQDAGIIRNKQKIHATVVNAQQFIRLQKQHGSFSKYIWQFTNGTTLYNNWHQMSQLPAKTTESDAMSKALIKEGFKFVGSTICYALMQAAGMVHDHISTCFRYKNI